MTEGGTRWSAIAAIVLAGIAAAAQIGKVPAAMTTIAAQFGLTLTAAALLVALFALLAGLGGLAIGLAASRIGARQCLLSGLALGSVASFAAAFSPGPASLFAARIAEGAGFLFVVVSAPALIATLAATPDRAFAMGLWGIFMPTGIALGLSTAPLVEAAGWRIAWLGCAALLAGAALLCWQFVPASGVAPAAPAGRARDQLRALVAAGRPLRVALCFAAYNVVYFGVAAFLPAYLETRGARTGMAGAAAAVAAVAHALGNVAAGLLMRRGAPPARLVAIGALGMAVLAAGVFLAGAAWLAVALAVSASCIGGLVPAACFALVPQSVPEPALVPPAIGLTIQGNNLMQLLAPPLLGTLAGLGWAWLALPMIAGGMASAWLAATLARQGPLLRQ